MTPGRAASRPGPFLAGLAVLLVPGCAAPPPPDTGVEPLACNGSPLLCSRPVDQVVFPTTHNAMSSEEDGWYVPNQHYDIPSQLADGVRGLMLDIHYDDGVVTLCHELCALGSQTLHQGLREITDFLDANPAQVIAIVFESYVEAQDAVDVFHSLGLDDRAISPPTDGSWPTLEEMTAGGYQLLVFSDEGGGDPPWYMDLWGSAWETPWDNQEPDDLTCERTDRGSADNPFGILNHFLTDPVASPQLAEEINYDPFFGERVQDCTDQWGRPPSFVAVDFYDIGDLFTVVSTANGLE